MDFTSVEFYLITKRSHGPWFPKVQFSSWDHYDNGAHCFAYGSCPINACFYLCCKVHCAGTLELGSNPIFASTKHVTLGQSLPVYGLQSPLLWNKDMAGRFMRLLSALWVSVCDWLNGGRIMASQMPQLCFQTPADSQKCPALGWEWLASCFPEDPMPESLVTSFGTSEGNVFQTYSVAMEFPSKE